MQPWPIVEHLDELEHGDLRFFTCMKLVVMPPLILERTEEARDYRVGVAIARSTHAGHQPRLAHLPLVRDAGVGRPLIRVMNQTRLRASVGQRQLQGLEHDVLIWLSPHRPPDDPPRVEIPQDGHVQPASPCRNRRPIAGPDPIGRSRHKYLLKAVRRRGSELMPFDHHLKPPYPLCDEPVLAPQPGHTMPPAPYSRAPPRAPEFHGAIPPLRLSMQSLHLLQQAGIGGRPRTDGSAPPRLVAAPTDAPGLTKLREPVLGPMGMNEAISHGDSRAKNAAAFFNMSRSSRSRAFSRRSRASSSMLWARPPLPGNAASPCVSSSRCHFYR